MIPKLIHFCFGLSEDFGGRAFSFVHYLAVKTAFDVNRPDAIRFHYEHEPSGYWWEKAKPYLTLNRIQAPKAVFGNPLPHYAHRADVVRLETLIREGGIYLDIDVLCLKSFEPLRGHDCVMGWEKPDHLCNAVILARPGAEFLKRWLERYRTFRSRGRDAFWTEHSVLAPAQLAKDCPELIHTVDDKSFFFPCWDRPELMWSNVDEDFSRSYCVHLWETLWWDPYLRHLTPYSVGKDRTAFAKLFSKAAAETKGEFPARDGFRYWTKRVRAKLRPRARLASLIHRSQLAWQFGSLAKRKLPDEAWILDIGGRGKNQRKWFPGWGGVVELRTLGLYDETDFRDDALTLSTIEDDTLDGIYTSHLIEHIWWWKSDELLRTWLDKLKPGARIEIRCPDMEWIFKSALEKNDHSEVWDDVLLSAVYGAAVVPWNPNYKDEGQYHRNLFWERKLVRDLETAGFTRVKRLRYGGHSYDRWKYDLRWAEEHGKHTVVDLVVEAYKPVERVAKRSPVREVFSEIYEKKLWGDHSDRFYSGPGSDHKNAQAYCEYLRKFITQHGVRSIVDIGCGDFRVAKHFVTDAVDYVGIDVVPSLIEYNQKTFSSARVRFSVADIIEDELPPADLCTVRQVLQHLCNRDVSRVLRKLSRYRYVIVTEHHPLDALVVAPNLDISAGSRTRVDVSSGLFLDREPFAVSGIRSVLETDLGAWGKLTTYLLENSAVKHSQPDSLTSFR